MTPDLEWRDPVLVAKMRAGVARMDAAIARGAMDPPSIGFVYICARACDRLGLPAEAAIVRAWPVKGGLCRPAVMH